MSILTDVRYALRRFQASPGFVAVATVTLALGIGATTAIYSIVDALMLRPLPFADSDRLVELSMRTTDGRASFYFDGDRLSALEARTDLFAGVSYLDYGGGTLPSVGEPKHDGGLFLGGAMMNILGVSPFLGRTIQPADVVPGAPRVMVLSYGAWREQFGADRAIVGRVISFEGEPVEVIGVMPPSFAFTDGRRRFWMPFVGKPQSVQAVARLRADIGIEQALARLESSTIPFTDRDGRSANASLVGRPLRSRQLSASVRTAILVLAGAVAMVLLIACANIANLLLVQNAGRDREVAVRAALGASRQRLLRQLLVEGALIACIGGALGLLVAQWAIALLGAMVPSDMTFLSANEITLDRRVMIFAVLLTGLTGLLFSALPALKSSRLVLFDALKAGARNATQTGGQERLRRAFIVAQLAVSCMLLVGAALLGRTFVHLLRVDPGFDADRLAIVQLQLPSWKYRTGADRWRFFQTLAESIRTLPGVTGATVSGGAPPSSGDINFGMTFEVEGRGPVPMDGGGNRLGSEGRLVIPSSAAPPDYFSVMGIPLTRGRTFTSYASEGIAPEIILNEPLAARLFNLDRGDDPIGKRIRLSTRPEAPWYTVVGVAGKVYQFSYESTADSPSFYRAARRDVAGPVQTIAVRTAGDPSSIVPLVREQVRALDPAQPIWRLGSVKSQYAEFFAVPRFYMFLMTTFAVLGIAIAAVGLYGVLAYAIAQRTREFGVRLALGATKADVLRMVLRQGATVTAVGLVIGVAGSAIMTRWLESMLVDISRVDPIAYLVVAALFSAIALAACWIPARRATNVDPIVALRYE